MFCELLTGDYGRNRQIVNQTHFPFLPKCVRLVAQSCLTLCNPMHHSLPGSSVHGILQARILKWIAIPFSRGSSSPRDLLHCRQILSHLSHQGSPFFLITQDIWKQVGPGGTNPSVMPIPNTLIKGSDFHVPVSLF